MKYELDSLLVLDVSDKQNQMHGRIGLLRHVLKGAIMYSSGSNALNSRLTKCLLQIVAKHLLVTLIGTKGDVKRSLASVRTWSTGFVDTQAKNNRNVRRISVEESLPGDVL